MIAIRALCFFLSVAAAAQALPQPPSCKVAVKGETTYTKYIYTLNGQIQPHQSGTFLKTKSELNGGLNTVGLAVVVCPEDAAVGLIFTRDKDGNEGIRAKRAPCGDVLVPVTIGVTVHGDPFKPTMDYGYLPFTKINKFK